MTKRFIVAAFAGMLTIAIVGGMLYGVVFASFFRTNIIDPEVMKTPPEFIWIALSHVPFGVLLTLVVSWRGVLTLRGGARTGGLLGLLMAASYNLSQYGTMEHWTLRLTLVEPFITMAMVATAGAVVAAVLARIQVPTSMGR
jgi:uncharacterized membrane protein